MKRCVLALDIGGTKLAAARVDENGDVQASARADTPRAGDAEDFLTALVGVAAQVRAGDEVACGVGTGGPMLAGGEAVSPLNIPQVREFPLRRRLAEVTGLRTFVDNDAKALTLGEGWRGAAVGCRNFMAMVVSTGVGGGIVVDGRLLDGAEGNAGHVGHLIVEPGGRRCACGARGCLEAEASGTALAAILGAPAATAPVELRRRTGTLVGRAVAGVVHLLDLRLVAVAGSVALGFGDDFFAAARSELARCARLDFATGATIVPAGLGPQGPLVGAAAVAWRALPDGPEVLAR